ncbi:MAG: short-chain dehydrogenase [Alphaproteobacteria bacterium 13_2_20CM_2_64_7]|jgi:rhamnose utilization protein RhaD (predicted bifunctional aldolase and dehydrogenase)/NAD(P)-dependent dehydrogenase (short-subunit alcohol dehydrogenase family)|nr:MAG: short-chain dehydrogenase [Alphaproteobacteria bacterium 13_2_20CM_2_64_7]
MKSGWVDSEAQAAIDRYAGEGIGRDLALRVYTTRLLGRDPKLVLHGGGNTSVKTTMADLLGEQVAVLCVKGSGSDMATIEPADLPAVRLDRLRKLRARAALSDEDMVRIQRDGLLEPAAPNPSVETLLHAFLPHRFVDHTHANAILSIVDQPDGEALCAELYDGRASVVPYVMPGFGLAKTAADIYDCEPAVEGLILHKHGIFTFGDSAREAYERMIALVTLAEQRLQKNRKAVFVTAQLPQAIAPLAAVAPILRGACSRKDERIEGAWHRMILDFRTSPAILNFVNGGELVRYSQPGVVTPDHTIRTKNWPLVTAAPERERTDDFKRATRAAVTAFVQRYEDYFARQNARTGGIKRPLDPLPRVALVPGLGLFGLGRSKKDARIAADLAQCATEIITDAEAIGRFESISEAEMFDMEYWSLEQAKLGRAAEKPLAGQVTVITGAGGTIGVATAKAFAAAGAEVALLELDERAAADSAKAIGGAAVAVQCDVTSARSVSDAFAQVAEAFGGVDIVVSNAGAAWQGRIGEVDEEVLRKSFEVNFYGHQRVAQAAVKIMLAQGTGGCLLFNVSKQAVNPGPNFGPYGLPKAATLFLVRQYAVDYGADGIRANAVNADRIRSGLLTDAFIAERAKARGVSEKDYLSGNLLGREVTADDVAQAFLHQALELKTTGDVTTVDGGNIAAALR